MTCGGRGKNTSANMKDIKRYIERKTAGSPAKRKQNMTKRLPFGSLFDRLTQAGEVLLRLCQGSVEEGEVLAA